jgi:hypothetical protein
MLEKVFELYALVGILDSLLYIQTILIVK